MAGFDYTQLTKDAELRNFLKFTVENPTIEGVIEGIDPLRPNSFNALVYTYHIRDLRNGVLGELTNGSGRLMKEFIRLNVEPSDTVSITRKTTVGKPMDTKYEVEIKTKGDGRKAEVVPTTDASTPATEEPADSEIPF